MFFPSAMPERNCPGWFEKFKRIPRRSSRSRSATKPLPKSGPQNRWSPRGRPFGSFSVCARVYLRVQKGKSGKTSLVESKILCILREHMIEFPRRQAFCDTSFFFAALYPKDVNYQRAGRLLEEALAQEVSLWTTWDIISETATLLLYRFNARAALRFLDEMKPSLQIVYYDESVREEAERVFRLFTKDKKLSFCDAISYVVVKTILQEVNCLSFDEDFIRLGLNVIH